MKVIIISGFLGSGKTSLIASAANALATDGIRLAVIENEISNSGLDGKFLKKHSLKVRELVSGCICCQLQGELQGAVEGIVKDYKPDMLFIEPTGAAAPGQVKDVVENNSCIDEIIMVSVLDAKRFAEHGLEQYPFVEQSVRKADLVVISKIDMVSPGIVKAIFSSAGKFNSSIDIIPLSLESGENLMQFTKKLKAAGKFTSQIPNIDIELLQNDHPVSVSFHRTLTNISHEEVEKIIDEILNELVKELFKNGCSRIGHIKVIAEKGDGFMFFSRISFSGINTKKCILPCDDTNDCKISGNIIVYGLSQSAVETINRNVLSRTLPCLLFA